MSNADNLNELYNLMKMDKQVRESVKKPKMSVEEEQVTGNRLAERYERQRRERKEKLYSYHLESR